MNTLTPILAESPNMLGLAVGIALVLFILIRLSPLIIKWIKKSKEIKRKNK
jgi:hypothetical protein